MTNHIIGTSQQKAARIAGLSYFLIIITSLLSAVFIDSKLTVEGDVAATVNNIMANKFLFAIGAAYDLTLYAGVVILALSLYVTLKPVSKNLALLALFWRLGEAILGGFYVFSSLIVLLLIHGKNYSAIFGKEQLQALVGLFLDARWAGLIIVIVFLSLGSIVFCYLFYMSKYIPRILAAFGIFSYLLMLAATFAKIFSPNLAEFNMIFLIPTFLFEMLIGLWLSIKGVNVEQGDNRVPASP